MSDQPDVKRIRKSFEHKVIDGVCGGVAEYFGIDPTLVRIGWVLAALAGGIGIFLYIIAMIIMPSPLAEQMVRTVDGRSSTFLLVLGIILSTIGMVLFLGVSDLLPFHWYHMAFRDLIVPLVLIGLGIALLMRRGTGAAEKGVHAEQGDPISVSGEGRRTRRLYRSRREKKLFGVCGGLGDYFGIDPVIVRLLLVVAAFVSFGLTVVAYIVLSLLAPQEPIPVSA